MPSGKDNSDIHILIVEDQVIYRNCFALILEDLGYRISAAGDGQEALEMILSQLERGELYDLLITDIEMPHMTGTELVVRLREDNIMVPVIFISGQGPEAVASALPNDEWSSYMGKPVEIMHLEQMMENVLRGRTLPENAPLDASSTQTGRGTLG